MNAWTGGRTELLKEPDVDSATSICPEIAGSGVWLAATSGTRLDATAGISIPVLIAIAIHQRAPQRTQKPLPESCGERLGKTQMGS